MAEESEYDDLPSSEEMLRAFSSEDMIREARESLQSDTPDIEVPELETEVEVEVDFEDLAAQEPEPEIRTTFTPRTRRTPPPATDPTIPQPHERSRASRGLVIGIAAWVVLLGIAVAVIALLAVETP